MEAEIVARAVLTLSFGGAAITKVWRPAPFLRTLRDLGIATHARAIGAVVLTAELAIVAALALGPYREISALGAAGLLGAFSAAVLARPMNTNCGCGLPGRWTTGSMLARNAILTAAAAIAAGSFNALLFVSSAAVGGLAFTFLLLRLVSERQSGLRQI